MSKSKSNSNRQSGSVTVEEIVSRVQQAGVPVLECMAIVGVIDGEVSGVVMDATMPNGGYVDAQPLGPGVYLVIGLGDLPTKMRPGVNDILVGMG
jgi:hypothetical protein